MRPFITTLRSNRPSRPLGATREARRILSINDQIVSGVGLGPDAETVRIGIATLYAGNLAGILRECGRAAHPARVQVRCDHSSGLLRGLRAGLLDLVLARGNEEELKGALAQWPEPVVWVRAPDFSMAPGAPVPLVTSPNLLPVDRIAVAALEAANCRYEVVFTAFDTMARRAAVAAGLGYCPTTRPTASACVACATPCAGRKPAITSTASICIMLHAKMCCASWAPRASPCTDGRSSARCLQGHKHGPRRLQAHQASAQS